MYEVVYNHHTVENVHRVPAYTRGEAVGKLVESINQARARNKMIRFIADGFTVSHPGGGKPYLTVTMVEGATQR